MENPHENHRERLKSRYLEEGFDAFAEHNILELILGYSIPRKDTNGYAHELIKTFGTLQNVFEADVDELIKVKGITLHSAILLKTYADVARFYKTRFRESEKRFSDTKSLGRYLCSLFADMNNENVLLLCFNARNSVIKSVFVHEGSINKATFRLRKITETALKTEAAYIVIAHNHPSGSAAPSIDDLDTTRRMSESLATNGIFLKEHFIISGDKYTPIISEIMNGEIL